MPVVPTSRIVRRAFSEGYAVAAINVVNGLTMEAVLAAAEELDAPLIVQTSVKTVKSIGLEVLIAMWRAMTASIRVPVALHLDHCPEREVISACLAAGWNSVLFDASSLSVAENQRQCIEVVAEARRVGADVEGEIERITGVEDDVGSDEESASASLETAIEFIQSTGIDIFAPAIGNRHGLYREPPRLNEQRVTELVDATGIPMALHGGTGIGADQLRELISRGCAKVNISTALKISFMDANRAYLAANPGAYDPPALFSAVRRAVMDMAGEQIRQLGGAGRAR